MVTGINLQSVPTSRSVLLQEGSRASPLCFLALPSFMSLDVKYSPYFYIEVYDDVELINLVTYGPTGPVDSNWKNPTGKLPVESNWRIRLDYYQLISTGVIPVEFHQLGYQLEINGFQLFQNPVGLTGNRISNRKILTGISFWGVRDSRRITCRLHRLQSSSIFNQFNSNLAE